MARDVRLVWLGSTGSARVAACLAKAAGAEKSAERVAEAQRDHCMAVARQWRALAEAAVRFADHETQPSLETVIKQLQRQRREH
jgi:hypothetical protein